MQREIKNNQIERLSNLLEKTISENTKLQSLNNILNCRLEQNILDEHLLLSYQDETIIDIYLDQVSSNITNIIPRFDSFSCRIVDRIHDFYSLDSKNSDLESNSSLYFMHVHDELYFILI